MKRFLASLILFISFQGIAQVNPCTIVAEQNEEGQSYLATQDYMLFERQFGDLKLHFFFSIDIINEVPTLSMTIVNQSARFIPIKCLSEHSKMFIQLENGKVVSLLHMPEDNCGTAVNADGINKRIYQAQFLFHKNSFDELLNSPMSLIRLRWGTDTEDFIIKPYMKSETDGKDYYPTTYFQTVLKCLNER